MTPPFASAAVPRGDARADRVQAELVKLLFLNFVKQFPVLIIFAPIVVPVMWKLFDHMLLALWGVLYMASLIERRWTAARYFRARPPDADALVWARAFAVRTVIGGLLIGLCGPWMFTFDSLLHQIFLITFICFTAAGGLTVYSSYLPGFYFYLPAVTLPLAFTLFSLGGAAGIWAGFSVVLFIIVVLRAAHDHHETTRRNLVLRFENQDLAEELARKKEEAEAAVRAKSQFLAAASHDLRQPMQSLSLLTASLDLRLKSTPEREIVRRINASVEALDSLFDALLDISKLDAAVIVPQRAAVPLGDVFAKLEAEFATACESKRLRLRVVPTRVWVDTDPVLLGRLLQNLLANAIRYTPKGAVMLCCRRRGARVQVEVRDSGLGIAHEHQARVFEEYYQVSNPERDRRKGLGLGLAIVKRLAVLLDHRLTLRSRENVGSVFALSLPVVPAPRENTVIGDEPAANFGGRRVAVIDDDPDVLAAMGGLLEEWGCEVCTAASGEEAERLLRGRAPELVVTDYRLRGAASGIAVIKRIEAKLGVRIPTILVSGDTAPELLREATASGIPLLHKPVRAARLRAEMARLLHRS